MDLGDLKGAPRTAGDWATLLIAGTVGYTLDAGLDVVAFFAPGVCGSTCALGSRGLKKAIEAATESSRSERSWVKAQQAELQSTKETLTFLENDGFHHEHEVLQDLNSLLTVAMIRQYSASEIRDRVDEILKRYDIPF